MIKSPVTEHLFSMFPHMFGVLLSSKNVKMLQVNLFWEVLQAYGKEDKNEENIDETDKVNGIGKDQFLQVANLLNVNLVEDSSTVNIFYIYARDVYMSRPSRFIRTCVSHRYNVRLIHAFNSTKYEKVKSAVKPK